MKTTFITICILTLFATATASSFSDGMGTGFVVSNVGRRIGLKEKKKPVIKYNNFTRDTSLQKFPPISSPQCIPEKKLIIHPPLTFVQRCVSIFVLWCILMLIGHMLFFAPRRDREWFLGYFLGRMMEEMLNGDN